jgi:hypothetical protein
MKRALRICRHVESAFSTLQSATRSAVFPDPWKLSVAVPYTFLSAAVMIFMLGAGLFSVDTHISKKMRIAR